MLKGLFANSSPLTQFIMLCFTMLICVLLFWLIGVLLAPLVMGIPIAELITGNGKEVQSLNLMRYLQIISMLGLFIVPAFLAAYLFSETTERSTKSNVAGYLSLERASPVKWFGATLLLILAVIPCINMLASLNEMIVFPKFLSGLEERLRNLEETAQQTTRLFLNVDSIGGMFFNILMMAILPALGEELIFRGVLQKIFARWTGNIHIAIVVVGFLFSLMHGQFYGFFPRWLLGVMFGYLLIWSGTIWLPIFAHFVNNTVAVCISYLIQQGTISDKVEEFGANISDIPLTIVATAIAVWILWRIYRSKVKPVFQHRDTEDAEFHRAL